MADALAELIAELRTEWRNPYWWADHPTLRAVLITLTAGLAGLAIEYLKLRMHRAMTMETA